MIIEYAGLPGSGKSTLRSAFLSLANRAGTKVYERETLQQELIASLIPLNRSGPLRRLSTAAYKLLLIRNAMTNRAAHLEPGELFKAHLVRASQRLIESQLLFSHAEHLDGLLTWIDLDEGVCQNFISLQVWRRLLEPGNDRVSYDWLKQHFENQPHALVTLELPAGAALQRLSGRGRPPLWPRDIPSDEILDAYQQELATVQSILDNEPKAVTAISVSAAIPEAEWPDTAQTLLAMLKGPRS